MNRPCRNADARAWFVNGLLHRKHGQAIEYKDGSKSWYHEGNLYYLEKSHREPRRSPFPGLEEHP